MTFLNKRGTIAQINTWLGTLAAQPAGSAMTLAYEGNGIYVVYIINPGVE